MWKKLEPGELYSLIMSVVISVLIIIAGFVLLVGKAQAEEKLCKDWYIGSTYALPYLDEGVGGSGVHVECRTENNYYLAGSVVNMRYADKFFIGPQASLMFGRQWESKNFMGIRLIGRLGVEVTTGNEAAVSGHYRLNEGIGIKALGVTCMHLHGSTAGITRMNHGEDRGICMVRWRF